MSENKQNIINLIDSNIIADDKVFDSYVDQSVIRYINLQLADLKKLAKTL